MEDKSPFLLVKRLQSDVLRLLSQVEPSSGAEQRKIEQLQNNLIDVRIEIQDYELAETRGDQLRNKEDAEKYLQKIKSTITDSSINVFGAVDVAHLTAQVEQITDRLR